jgi:hypothetical protein
VLAFCLLLKQGFLTSLDNLMIAWTVTSCHDLNRMMFFRLFACGNYDVMQEKECLQITRIAQVDFSEDKLLLGFESWRPWWWWWWWCRYKIFISPNLTRKLGSMPDF